MIHDNRMSPLQNERFHILHAIILSHKVLVSNICICCLLRKDSKADKSDMSMSMPHSKAEKMSMPHDEPESKSGKDDMSGGKSEKHEMSMPRSKGEKNSMSLPFGKSGKSDMSMSTPTSKGEKESKTGKGDEE